MAPGYITESVGIEYTPDKTFSLRFGTGTARQTLILDAGWYLKTAKASGSIPVKTSGTNWPSSW